MLWSIATLLLFANKNRYRIDIEDADVDDKFINIGG